MTRLATALFLSDILSAALTVQGHPMTGGLIFLGLWFVSIVRRGYQIRVANGEYYHRYHGDDVAGHVIHGARWLAAAAIIGANMNRRGNVSFGALSLARMVLGRRPWKRGRK